MKSKQAGAYLLYMTSMLIYGTIGIFRKYIPLSSAMLVFARGLIGGVFLFTLIKCRGGSLKMGFNRKKSLLLILSGFALGINWILLFESYRFTSVAVATLCYYMQPTLLILLSPLLFGEKLTLKKGFCAFVSVAGMVLVSGIISIDSPMASSDILGILLGLGASVFYALVVILNKKLPTENVYGKTMVELFSGAFILLPYLLLTEKPIEGSWDISFILPLLIVGIIHTGVAYTLYFGSMHRLPSQTVAILSYIDPVLALILSFTVLGESLVPLQLLGAVMIVGSAMFSEISSKRKAQQENLH